VVEKSRDIYEELMQDEELEEAEGIESEEDCGGDQAEDLIADVEADEEGISEDEDEDEAEDKDYDEDGEQDEHEGDHEELEDRVVDLEDKLDELMAEFEDAMKPEGEEEAPADEAEMEPEAEEPAEMDGDLELTDDEAQAIIDLGSKLEAAMGGMEDMDMGGEEAPEMEMDAGGDMDAEEELMEALRGISYTPSRTEVVNEVAKRVAKRLKTAKLHEAKLKRALGRK